MDRWKVFVAQWMPGAGLDLLREACDLDYEANVDPLPAGEFLARAERADALVLFVSDFLDGEMIARCPRLKVVSSFGKGFDNIDVDACTRRGVLVTVNPDALTESTADLAIALILASCRNVVSGDRHVRSGRFRGWHPTDLLGRDFHHSALGIVGFGAIGQAIARRARAFDVRVSYHDPVRRPALEGELGVSYAPFDLLLPASDFVVISADLRPENRHLLGTGALKQIKRGAYLVNVGRGSLVDESAVAGAIADGLLRGYAADVFEFEDRSVPGRLLGISPTLLADDVATVFTPHLGTGTAEARDRLAISTAGQLLAALRGEIPSGAINPQALSSRNPG